MFGEDEVKKPKGHEVGMPIETMSVDELEQRIGLLREEIVRLEQAIEHKRKSKSQADSLFRL